MADPTSDPSRPADEFAREAERKTPGLARELWAWLRHNKKWWLAPLLIVLFVVGVVVVVGSTVLGPFLYPLF